MRRNRSEKLANNVCWKSFAVLMNVLREASLVREHIFGISHTFHSNHFTLVLFVDLLLNWLLGTHQLCKHFRYTHIRLLFDKHLYLMRAINGFCVLGTMHRINIKRCEHFIFVYFKTNYEKLVEFFAIEFHPFFPFSPSEIFVSFTCLFVYYLAFIEAERFDGL